MAQVNTVLRVRFGRRIVQRSHVLNALGARALAQTNPVVRIQAHVDRSGRVVIALNLSFKLLVSRLHVLHKLRVDNSTDGFQRDITVGRHM